MTAYNFFSFSVIIALFYFGCTQQMESDKTETTENKTEQTAIPLADNSMTSLDWDGTYFGVLPCANCEGVETTITLSKDLTYSLKSKYVGKSEEVFEKSGSFTWNEANTTITLGGFNEGEGPSKYFVGENRLTQLDMEGNKISGALAEKYVLTKTQKVSLTDTKWKLTEIMGKPVKYSNPESKEIFIQLISEDNKAFGFSGSNTFRDSYELKDGNRISFSKMASTL
ncbi:MAG: copper resistance protein NlpE N-terminal domain-containing protein, partial [Ignavibacterium sp.]